MTEEQIRALIDGLRAQGMTDEIIADMLQRQHGVTDDQLPPDFGLGALFSPPQPATQAPPWMDDAQAARWEALLPHQRDVYAMQERMAADGVAPQIEDLPTRAAPPFPPVVFPSSRQIAATDKEIAGATNDQLAQLMAQADPSLGVTGHDLSLTQLPGADAITQQARLSRDIDAMSASAPTNRSEVLDPWAKETSEAGELAKDAEKGAETDWSDYLQYGGLAAGLAGTALGVAAPFLERDRGYEASLKRRAAGDTVARQEMDYAAGQMRRNIMGSAMGRRDISPALAMRNAQMAQSQASSQMMARAAMASAQERQMAENELATIRKQRTGQAIDAGLASLSQLGAFGTSLAASQKQNALADKRLQAYQDRTLALQGEYVPPDPAASSGSGQG